MEVNVLNIKGEDTGRKVTLSESIFGIEPNDHAIYLDVKQFMANQRQGTHKSKERSEISGSTRSLKPRNPCNPCLIISYLIISYLIICHKDMSLSFLIFK